MAHVHIIQRNAHLASAVQLDHVKGHDGPIARAVLTAISNQYRGSGAERQQMTTAIRWTLWGPLAENAAAYLDKGSHVNLVGWVRNDIYQDGDGREVHGLSFTAEEVDFLDSRAQAQERQVRRTGRDTTAAQR
ncbi:MAG: single-stranded DNA-binding protein [Hydrogenophaga sp.]|jgi:single-stranded DNA-binding protein|nr:single-stranded DNA-binding protein [Hydrogenophaga sp.]